MTTSEPLWMIIVLDITHKYYMERFRENWKISSLIIACMTLVRKLRGHRFRQALGHFKMSFLLHARRQIRSVTPSCFRELLSVRWGQKLCFWWSTHRTSDSMSRSTQPRLSIVTMEIASFLLSRVMSREEQGVNSSNCHPKCSALLNYHCTLASPHSISMMRWFNFSV